MRVCAAGFGSCSHLVVEAAAAHDSLHGLDAGDLLEIELGRKTGHCRDTLAAVALLDTDVHFALFQARVTSIQCSGCVLEGVCIIPDM